jgi:putative ABC transport system permease protein
MSLSLQDVRFSLRSLRKSPALVLASVSVLALGMGATSAMLSVVDSVLVRPLPFAQQGRLVRISRVAIDESSSSVGSGFSMAAFRMLRERCRSLDGVSIYRGDLRNLTNLGDPESVPVATVETGFFSLLGVSASHGRVLGDEDALTGSPLAVVIGDAFWKSHFGSDPSAVGRELVLNRERRRIVGILPASAHVAVWYPASVQIWIPLRLPSSAAAPGFTDSVAGAVIGRLAPGVTAAAAQAEIDTMASSFRDSSGQTTPWRSSVLPLSEYLVRLVRPTLLALLGAALCVLLIATANFANLLLVRSLSRSHEVAIRMALGADRSHLLGGILVETLVISLTGAAAGLLVAKAGIRVLVAAFGATLPRLTQVRVSYESLGATLFVAVLAGLAAAAAPSWRLTRRGVRDLSQLVGARDARPQESRARNRIVVAEVAFATMLLLAAGWMARSVSALRGVPLGFEPRGLLTMTLSFPVDATESEADYAALVGRVLESVRRVPGVVDAGVVNALPVVEEGPLQTLSREGTPHGEARQTELRSITPGYLAAMRTPIRMGRDILETDGAGAPAVALVSESSARALWPNESPLGKILLLSGSPHIRREVVGVTADVKLHDLDAIESETAVYLPAAQSAAGSSLAVRSRTSAGAIQSSVRHAIRGTSSELLLAEVAPMEDLLSDSIAHERFRASLAGLFAAVALALAAIGASAVLSYTSRRRSREIGIRMALGAAARDVLLEIVIEGMKPVLVGGLLGALGALAIGRVLAHELFGVRTTDPLMFAVAFCLLGFVGLLASVVPAARAARSDPLAILREE